MVLATELCKHFLKITIASHVLQFDFENLRMFKIREETLSTSQTETKLSSGLETRISAKVYPADTVLLEATKVIKSTLNTKQVSLQYEKVF